MVELRTVTLLERNMATLSKTQLFHSYNVSQRKNSSETRTYTWRRPLQHNMWQNLETTAYSFSIWCFYYNIDIIRYDHLKSYGQNRKMFNQNGITQNWVNWIATWKNNTKSSWIPNSQFIPKYIPGESKI